MYKPVGVLAAFSEKGEMKPAYIDMGEERLCKVIDVLRSEWELYAINRLRLYTCNVQTIAGVEQIRIRHIPSQSKWIMLDRAKI